MKNRNIFLAVSLVLILSISTWLMTRGHYDTIAPSGPQYGAARPSANITVYSFTPHPLYNPAKLSSAYQPLVDYLNARLPGVRLELEASRDYASFEAKYASRRPAFILPNPWQTIQAKKVGYHVIAQAGEPTDFYGIFIVRKDRNISRPSDLKGKIVSYPAATALAACIMPQYFLFTHGLNVNKDIQNRFVGSQESSIMNVYMGLSSAGATWPPPWRLFQKEHPDQAAQLKVMWQTESLINNSVMARDDLPPHLVARVKSLLIDLDKSAEGRAILLKSETARFLPATDQDYGVVTKYMENFEKKVRKVETKISKKG